MKLITSLLASALIAASIPSHAAKNSVSITVNGDSRCVSSNGVPSHSIGKFPNRGNPHRFKKQKVSFCFDASPSKGSKPDFRPPTVGVTVTGIPIRPGTADYYDARSPRGHSRDRSSGWNLEGMGSAEALGMDRNNAHVDERGLYHYHGMPAKLTNFNGITLMGYAADGFEIHYVGKSAKPSWRLKKGERPTPPYGRYNGEYEEDWEYVKGLGNLDQCNGGKLNGRYVYYATDTFPFFPRCFFGKVSRDFTPRR